MPTAQHILQKTGRIQSDFLVSTSFIRAVTKSVDLLHFEQLQFDQLT